MYAFMHLNRHTTFPAVAPVDKFCTPDLHRDVSAVYGMVGIVCINPTLKRVVYYTHHNTT